MKIRIDKIPIANNRFLRMHWAERQKDKEEWCRYLLQHYKVRNEIKGKFVSMEIIVYRKKLQDKDNHWASLKNLIDALKDMDFIVDDSGKWLKLETRQVKSKEEYTKMIINGKINSSER